MITALGASIIVMLFLLCDALVVKRQSDGEVPKPRGRFAGQSLIMMVLGFFGWGGGGLGGGWGGIYLPLAESSGSLPVTSLAGPDRNLSACLHAPLSCQAAAARPAHSRLVYLFIEQNRTHRCIQCGDPTATMC